MSFIFKENIGSQHESDYEQLQEGDMDTHHDPDVCIEDQVQVRGQEI